MFKLDQDEPLGPEDVISILRERPGGVTLCVRSSAADSADDDRGGYFFHVASNGENSGRYFLTDFDAIPVRKSDGSLIDFDVQELCDFINHCTGTEFSEKHLILSQTEVNFRSDPDESEEDQ